MADKDEITVPIEGEEFNEGQIRALDVMFRSPGYVEYLRILGGIQKIEVAGTLGHAGAVPAEVFLRGQGVYGSIENIKEIKALVGRAVLEIEANKK